jgi:hypothetical protein
LVPKSRKKYHHNENEHSNNYNVVILNSDDFQELQSEHKGTERVNSMVKEHTKGTAGAYIKLKSTSSSGLFAIDVIEALIDDNGDSHHDEFPCSYSSLVGPTEHKEQVDN